MAGGRVNQFNFLPVQVQTRARGVTQTYSAHSFKDFTQKPEGAGRLGGDAWLRAGSGVAVLSGSEAAGGMNRNQFDRRSQLRRSKKQGRKKSSVSESSPVSSGNKTTSASADSSSDNGDEFTATEEKDDQVVTTPVRKTETLISSTPRSVEGIVKAEMRSERLTHILLNSSRTEYNSNYGNLI